MQDCIGQALSISWVRPFLKTRVRSLLTPRCAGTEGSPGTRPACTGENRQDTREADQPVRAPRSCPSRRIHLALSESVRKTRLAAGSWTERSRPQINDPQAYTVYFALCPGPPCHFLGMGYLSRRHIPTKRDRLHLSSGYQSLYSSVVGRRTPSRMAWTAA